MSEKQKMTVSNSSAGTDERQPYKFNCNKNISNKDENVKGAEALDTFILSEL